MQTHDWGSSARKVAQWCSLFKTSIEERSLFTASWTPSRVLCRFWCLTSSFFTCTQHQCVQSTISHTCTEARQYHRPSAHSVKQPCEERCSWNASAVLKYLAHLDGLVCMYWLSQNSFAPSIQAIQLDFKGLKSDRFHNSESQGCFTYIEDVRMTVELISKNAETECCAWQKENYLLRSMT